MLRTSFSGEELTHRLLWRIVKEQAKEAQERAEGICLSHGGSAFELCGERIAPEVWKDERNFFRNEPYRGALGKMRKVMDLVGLPWTADVRPLKTVLELKKTSGFDCAR